MTTRAFGWVAPEQLGRAPHTGLRATARSFAGLRPTARLEHLPPVYDQGGVGSCTAQALAGAVEALLPRAGYPAERLDRVALYRRERDLIGTPMEDSGAMLGDGVRLLCDRGWERERAEPSFAFDRSWTVPAPVLGADAPRVVNAEPLDFDAVTIAMELDAGHVVVVGLRVTEQWQSAWGTPSLPPPGGHVIGGHAVALVGYDLAARCWVVRNSWGEAWGEGGYALLPWEWTEPPWCGEVYALRAVRRAMGAPDTDRGDAKREMEHELERPSVTDLLDGPVALVERELRASAPAAGLAPGLIVTVGDTAPVQQDLARALPLLRAIRPAVVMLHTYPGAEDAPTVAAIRAALPGVAIWLQSPANPLVGLTEARAVERVRGWVRAAIALGAELLSFNGEGADGNPTGWKPGQPLTAPAVAARAKFLLAAAHDEARGRLALGWSSHDHVESHKLPWREILGPSSPVTRWLPQVYCDPADGTLASIGGARARLETVAKQHGHLVDRGIVRPEFAPGGKGFVLYAQSHHHRVDALCWLLDRSELAASWTIRADGKLSDAAGLTALRADAELRRRVGAAPGRIARFQASAGLAADSVVGPRTLAALGVA